jgi:hypothetical protein
MLANRPDLAAGIWRSTPVEDSDDEDGYAQLAGGPGTLVQLPTRSVPEWTPATIRAALMDADSGSLARPADLVEAIMGDDRVQGVLSTRTHGLLGLPLAFEGGGQRPKKALEGQRGLEGRTAVPGDWYTMFPEAQLAQLTAWGIILGVGLGERVPRPRGLEEREVPELKVWHPRWLRQDVMTERWYLTTSAGEIEITPGDGRWILYLPYGNTRPWTMGAWRPLSFAWILKQFALHDRARHSEVQGSAARVGIAPQGASPAGRRQWLRDIRAMGRDNSMVLPFGYDYKVVEATGQTHKIYGDQIEWADRAIAITLAGQAVTTEGTTGFSNGNIHAAIKHDLIKFTAETLSTTLRAQGVVQWAEVNFGDPDVAPWPRWDTEPPADKKEMAEAMSLLGDAITKLDAALSPSGVRVDASELAARYGIGTIPLPAENAIAPSIALAPTDVAKIVTVNEGRAGAGLPPLELPGGGRPDPDGDLTIEEFTLKRAPKKGGASGTPGVDPFPSDEPPTPTEEEMPESEKLVAASAHAVDFERLDISVGDQEPPKEFRLFTAGTVETSKGTFTFDAESAKSVMAAYREQGNELMVDYDHASLSPLSVDPAQSGKAAGWFGLELRNGELWAVNVRWTPPADEALRRKEWRYMSPAFRTKGKKITAVINVALTNIPATKRLEPLMAASETAESGAPGATESRMDLTKILAALGLPADATEEQLLAALKPKASPAPAPAVMSDAAFEAIAREAHHDVRFQNEIGQLREEQRLSRVRDLLRSTDRHTTPSFESLAMTKTPEEVQAMLGALPAKPRSLYEPRGGRDAISAELTHAELRMCRLLDQDEAKLQAHKAKEIARARSNQRAYANALAAEMGDE